MEFRYSAFISYRHHPRDIRAAEQIQRGLEHYRVPRALRRQGRTIARLFRDYEDRLLCFDAAGACLWQAEAVGAAALSRQGDLLLTLEENRLRILDPDTGLARQPDRLLQPPEAPETARLRLDARTGTAQPVSLPDQAQGLPLTWEGPDAWPQTDGQRVFLLAQGQNGDTGGLFLAVWDSETGRTSVQLVGSQPAAGSRLLGARDVTAWLWNAADQTVCRVEADGRVQVLLQQVTEPPAARVLDESGLLALCQADRVLLFEENGPPRTLYTDGRRPVDCRLQDGVLLVLTGEATLLRLDPAEGRVLGETELEVYETYFSRFDSRYHTSRIHWEMVDEDTLFLDLFGAGNLLHTGQWERQGVVLDCAGCLPEAGLVLTERWVETERHLGSFPLYSLEQLQAMGRRALADGGTE